MAYPYLPKEKKIGGKYRLSNSDKDGIFVAIHFGVGKSLLANALTCKSFSTIGE